jgi:RimJ/RimL family protein N-acetyltransferase
MVRMSMVRLAGNSGRQAITTAAVLVVGFAGPNEGFALLPAGWGAGIATEAGRAVLAHGRDALGLTEVLAITSPDNTRSMRVLAKLDMALEDCRPLAEGAAAVNVFRMCLR